MNAGVTPSGSPLFSWKRVAHHVALPWNLRYHRYGNSNAFWSSYSVAADLGVAVSLGPTVQRECPHAASSDAGVACAVSAGTRPIGNNCFDGKRLHLYCPGAPGGGDLALRTAIARRGRRLQ